MTSLLALALATALAAPSVDARLEALERALATSSAHEKKLEDQNRALTARIDALELVRDKAEVEKAKKPQALKGDVGPAGRGASLGSADGKYRMRLGVRMQPGFIAQGFERDEDVSTYNVRRVKIYADGYLGRRETEYRYQFEAAGAGARLDDAYIQENFAHDFKARIGQFKLPASRQFLTSTRDLLFVDRALAAQIFTVNSPGGNTLVKDVAGLATHGVGRNFGLQLWGDIPLKAPPPAEARTAHGGSRSSVISSMPRSSLPEDVPFLRYFAVMANGAGQNILNENTGFLYLGRLELHPLGDFGYQEGLVDKIAEKPSVVVDATYAADVNDQRVDLDRNGIVARADREDREQVALGLAARWWRVFASAENFRQWTRPEAVRFNPVGSEGWYYQVGFLVIPKLLEIAWRDSAVDPDRARGADRLRETGVGVNYYLQGHAQKVYADVLHLSDAADPRSDHTRSRVQYQLTF